MSLVAEALLKERDAAYAERDLHICAGELMAQEIEKLRGASKALASWCVKNIQPNLEMDRLLHALDVALSATTEEPK